MPATVSPGYYRLFLTEAQRKRIVDASLKRTGLGGGEDISFSTQTIWYYTIFLIPMKIVGAIVFIFNSEFRVISSVVAWITASALLITVPNIWPYMLWCFRDHVTIHRYSLCHLIKSYWFWGFLLDQIVFVIPYLFLILPLSHLIVVPPVTLPGDYLIYLLIPILNFVVFVCIVVNKQSRTETDTSWALLNRTETAISPDNQLSILESDARSILLKNSSSKPLTGKFEIIRSVGGTKFDVQFALETSLQPGMQIKLIPEEEKTSNAVPTEAASQGVIRLRGYRSFGFNRKQKIVTEVFVQGKKIPCVRRTDIYEEKNEEKQVEETTVTNA